MTPTKSKYKIQNAKKKNKQIKIKVLRNVITMAEIVVKTHVSQNTMNVGIMVTHAKIKVKILFVWFAFSIDEHTLVLFAFFCTLLFEFFFVFFFCFFVFLQKRNKTYSQLFWAKKSGCKTVKFSFLRNKYFSKHYTK